MKLDTKPMDSFPLYQLGLALLVIIPLGYFIRSAARRHAVLRLPPGPWALPVIGHLHHLMDKPEQLHHKLRALAQRHGPVMLLRCGELPVVVASSMEAAGEIMKTQDLAFATCPISRVMRQVLVDGSESEGLILAPYGDGWRQLRKICSLELFSAHRVQSFRALREQDVQRLLRAVASTPPPGAANMTKEISSYVADSVVRAVIGSRFNDQKTAFFRLLEEGMKVFSRPSLPDLFPSSRLAMLISRRPRQMKQLRLATMAFMETIIQEHQVCKATAHEEEDLVDVLLRIQREGDLQSPLTMDNVKTVVADLIMAGSETSSTTLQWAMSELVKNPRVMHKAQEEVRRVLHGQKRVTEECLSKLHCFHLVIKETLRLHPPTPLLIPRECRYPCQILGFDIPVGAMLLVNAWAISRDTQHWDAPQEFVPERFEHNGTNFRGTYFEYTPFGAGRRMCPGMTFGLAIMEPALASLLYHFDWELPTMWHGAEGPRYDGGNGGHHPEERRTFAFSGCPGADMNTSGWCLLSMVVCVNLQCATGLLLSVCCVVTFMQRKILTRK